MSVDNKSLKNGYLKDESGNSSSKRIVGFAFGGVATMMGLILFFFSLFHPVADADTAKSIMNSFLFICGSLLGVTVFEKFGNKRL